MRTSLGVDGKSTIPGFANFFQRIIATQVNDVNRRARHLCQCNGSPYGLGLRSCRTRKGMIFRRPFPLGQGLLDDDVYRAAVFGMHANQAAVF